MIHLLDFHYVPEDRFRLDTPYGDYEAFLNQVAALQAQQRALIKAIGVRAVFLEGLTAESTPHFLRRVEAEERRLPSSNPFWQASSRFARPSSPA